MHANMIFATAFVSAHGPFAGLRHARKYDLHHTQDSVCVCGCDLALLLHRYNCDNGGPAPEKLTNAIYQNTTKIKEYWIADESLQARHRTKPEVLLCIRVPVSLSQDALEQY